MWAHRLILRAYLIVTSNISLLNNSSGRIPEDPPLSFSACIYSIAEELNMTWINPDKPIHALSLFRGKKVAYTVEWSILSVKSGSVMTMPFVYSSNFSITSWSAIFSNKFDKARPRLNTSVVTKLGPASWFWIYVRRGPYVGYSWWVTDIDMPYVLATNFFKQYDNY